MSQFNRRSNAQRLQTSVALLDQVRMTEPTPSLRPSAAQLLLELDAPLQGVMTTAVLSPGCPCKDMQTQNVRSSHVSIQTGYFQVLLEDFM